MKPFFFYFLVVLLIPLHGQPDLADTGISDHGMNVSHIGRGLPDLSVFGKVVNNGSEESLAFQVTLLLSLDDSLDRNLDIELVTKSYPALAPNAEVFLDFIDVTVPEDTEFGEYFVGWIINSSNRADETNKDNNEVLLVNGLSTLTVFDQSLSIDIVDARDNLHMVSGDEFSAGDEVTVSHYLRNIGISESGEFEVALVVSPDTTISEVDTVIGTAMIPSIAAEGFTENSITATLPTLPGGDYYFGWIIDSGNDIFYRDV